MPTDSPWRKKIRMAFRDITAWFGRRWRGAEPVAAAITVIEPFDDGLVEINRLLCLDDLPPSKPLPTFWL
jgi:hypothetical protein